jgi:hypothetical protein
LTGGFYPVTMHQDGTVRAVKERISHSIGLPPRQQRLSFSGRILENDHPLSHDRTLVNGCTLILEMVNAAGEAVATGGRGW